MKYSAYFLSGIILIGIVAFEGRYTPDHGTKAISPQNAPSGLAASVNSQLTFIERNITAVASAMPEGKFDFTPESLHLQGSLFDGVRTFAGQVKHLATDNYDMWCAITHDPLPAGIVDVNGPAGITTKADILKYLKGSFDEGRKAVEGLTTENATDLVEFRGSNMPRITLTYYALWHSSNHYGQLVVYGRMCGVEPSMGMKSGN